MIYRSGKKVARESGSSTISALISLEKDFGALWMTFHSKTISLKWCWHQIDYFLIEDLHFLLRDPLSFGQIQMTHQTLLVGHLKQSGQSRKFQPRLHEKIPSQSSESERCDNSRFSQLI